MTGRGFPKNGKQKRQRGLWPAFLLAALAILLYALLANALVLRVWGHKLKNAYKEVAQMDLASLDEEALEMLESFQAEGMEVLITDQAFAPVYVGKWPDAQTQIMRSVKGRLELFQDTPNLHARQYKNTQAIRLRARIRQGSETFYLYIRRHVRDVRAVAWYSALYFFLVWSCLAWAVYRSQKKGEKRLAAETRAQDPKDRALDEAQKEFVANVTHELKTPLTVISGQVEMLQSMGDAIDRDYYFSSIREEIDKMSEMVSNLLDLTILDHQMEEMELSAVDLSALMEYMALKYDALFCKNQIKVQTEIAAHCTVWGNRMYLEQAVNNYLMNAFQHTAQGARIAIRLTAGECARIGIFNEGDPIPPEDRELIWQGFYKSPSRRREKSPNLSNAGLGLYMVKKIVEQHHGACGADNRDGGVEFWMRLPLARGAAP